MSEVYIAVTVTNGEVYHLAVQTEMRAPSRPKGDGWLFDEKRAVWTNPVSDTYIEYLIAKNERGWAHRKDGRGMPAYDAVQVVSWLRLTQAEHEQFNQDRPYRNALRARNGKIEYDIAAARERCRELLRHQRAHAMPELDAQFMRALGQGKKVEQDAIEAERQKWRDAPADPRIDAAQSVGELKQIRVV
jgi:hypothetical protein